jgi:mono/diheme cytochrome c family protein
MRAIIPTYNHQEKTMERRSEAKTLALAISLVLMTSCGGDAPDTAPATSEPIEPAAPAAPAPAPTAATGAEADLLAQGQQVYSGPGMCFSCHGPAGQGTALAPDLTDDTWIWIENPQENLQAKLVNQIRGGTPQPREFPAPMLPMGGGSLTEDQLQAVAAYVASL